MSENTTVTPEFVNAEREAPKVKRQAKVQQLAKHRTALREAEQALKQLEAMPAESNEVLANLLVAVDSAAARYAHRIKGDANRPGKVMTLADLRLGTDDAQAYFGGARLREGLRRLFLSGNGGVSEAERLARRNNLRAEIIRLQSAVARMGG